MSVLKFNKVLSIFRTSLRMMSVDATRKFEGKVAVVTASTDGYETSHILYIILCNI